MSSGQLFDISRLRSLISATVPTWQPPVYSPRAVDVARATNVAAEAGTSRRFVALDAMRCLAAAGVVFVHSIQSPRLIPFAEIGHLSVPFYLFVALFMLGRSSEREPQRSGRAYLIGRFKRLYLPFLLWSVIYGIARSVKRVTVSGQSPLELSPRIFWSGTQYHLWFLPFLLAVSVIAALVHARLR